jgi:hypothetical protein
MKNCFHIVIALLVSIVEQIARFIFSRRAHIARDVRNSEDKSKLDDQEVKQNER